MMKAIFHLSIGVKSIAESVRFFVEVLEGEVTHRDKSGYVNVDLHGTQLTLQPAADVNPDLPEFHFGLNVSASDFERMSGKILKNFSDFVVMQPKVVDAGTSMERKKMFLRCPSGYAIELKVTSRLS